MGWLLVICFGVALFLAGRRFGYGAGQRAAYALGADELLAARQAVKHEREEKAARSAEAFDARQCNGRLRARVNAVESVLRDIHRRSHPDAKELDP